ncbi:MAG: EF-P lysine aminoacylase EpmA [Rubripirellula sp.]|jgi:lysyl-tRNA synthetase class 2|nr:EF-P lysine aminoacylase EpmA [Rubripirellula sp.]
MKHSQTPNLHRLRERAELLKNLRQFFDGRGFFEVQPPCLSSDCVIDPYIDPLRVSTSEFQLSADWEGEFFLQTSPEAAMKRMLAAGAPSIYSIGPVFRAGEQGEQHNLEFTMLEWYQVGADVEQGIQLLGALASSILNAKHFEVRPYRQLFRDACGLDPIDAPLQSVLEYARHIDASLADSLVEDRDGLLDLILSLVIQPNLGHECPTIVRDYPLSQAALAKPSTQDGQCAARFELFVSGVELANGYDELRDPDVLLDRFRACNDKRQKTGRRPLPLEIPLLEAMRSGLPQCAGVALGVDRLLTVQMGETEISSVMPFTILTA